MKPLAFNHRDPAESRDRATELHRDLATRRTIRNFSPDLIPDGLLDSCLAAAHTFPARQVPGERWAEKACSSSSKCGADMIPLEQKKHGRRVMRQRKPSLS